MIFLFLKETTLTSTPSPQSFSSRYIVTVIAVSIYASIVLLLASFLVWFMWRRKRVHRRKSQASTIAPITLSTSDGSDESRPSTFSSTRSISPLINFLYEEDNISELEPPDIEVISVLSRPAGEDTENMLKEKEQLKNRCYTLQEVDRICMEAIKGTTKKKKSPRQKRTNNRQRVSKTLSNGSSKSNYSSSGYGSGSSSPALNVPYSATSLTGGRVGSGRYSTVDKRYA